MKVAIGFDPFGLALRPAIEQHVEQQGYDVTDLGCQEEDPNAYYNVAVDAAVGIQTKQFDRAILVCGTGMGMAIVANKYPAIAAAVCTTIDMAKKARSINNANILTLGAMHTAPFLTGQMLDAFFTTEFKEGWDADIQNFLDQAIKDIALIGQNVSHRGPKTL